MLAGNIESLRSINAPLAERLELLSSDTNTNNYPPYPIISYRQQIERCVYISSGAYTLPQPIPDSYEIPESYSSVFESADISANSFAEFYQDVHSDRHFYNFVSLLDRHLRDNEIKITPQPNRRKNPCFLIILGLAGREKLVEFVETINPRHVLLVETEPNALIEFLRSNSLTEMRQSLKDSINCTMSVSIGLGEANDIINEIQSWAFRFGDLSIEGTLLSTQSYPSIKKDAVQGFLLNSTWHIDSIARMGYQTDEYNMLNNTALNFEACTQKIINPDKKLFNNFNIPVVVTGSGPSLDASIDYIKKSQDKCIIVSGGSSISTLCKNGIIPDIHVQLERSEHQADLHLELAKEYDLKNVLLISSSTTPFRLQQIFDKIIYFFRPALSPLALYANSTGEVLSCEGPDTINAAVSSVLALGFQNIALVGVDCGSQSKKSIRSKGAFGGYIPRVLNQVERGNTGKTVFTNNRLKTVRDALSTSIRVHKPSNIFNFSTGLSISGANYKNIGDFEEWIQSCLNTSLQADSISSILDLLWTSSTSITPDRLFTSWKVSNPRQKVFDFFRRCENIISTSNNAVDITQGISHEISLSRQRPTKSDQFVPRVVRGTLGKASPIIMNVSNRLVDEDNRNEFHKSLQSFMLDYLDALESDVYSVIDNIEPSPQA